MGASRCFKSWLVFWMIALMCEVGGAKDGILDKNPYASVPQIIASEGYPVERHRVITEDGYHLQLHRVPAGRRAGGRGARRAGAVRKRKQAVLLVHGLLGSSGDFVLLGTNRSLAFMLADNGYDVWLGNLRGTDYSSHTTVNKNDLQFWDYSFEEHGLYDVPAFIDKVLNVTGLEKLVYIGHSMGTTSMFITLSERDGYNDKVTGFIALAPAVYMDNLRGLVQTLMENGRLVDEMRSRGLGAIRLPRSIRDLVGSLCRPRTADNLCLQLIFSVVGEDVAQVDWKTLPVFIARSQPAALRQLQHFSKIAMAGEFVRWGDGMNDLSVPAYNLSKVRAPVQIYFGLNDQLTAKRQVMRLTKELNLSSDSIHPVAWKKFNHLDFIFARDLDKLLNNQLIDRVKIMYDTSATE